MATYRCQALPCVWWHVSSVLSHFTAVSGPSMVQETCQHVACACLTTNHSLAVIRACVRARGCVGAGLRLAADRYARVERRRGGCCSVTAVITASTCTASIRHSRAPLRATGIAASVRPSTNFAAKSAPALSVAVKRYPATTVSWHGTTVFPLHVPPFQSITGLSPCLPPPPPVLAPFAGSQSLRVHTWSDPRRQVCVMDCLSDSV